MLKVLCIKHDENIIRHAEFNSASLYNVLDSDFRQNDVSDKLTV